MLPVSLMLPVSPRRFQPTEASREPTEASRERKDPCRPPSIVSVSPEEWRAILTVRPNLLIEGPNATTEVILRALGSHCALPVVWWSDGLPRGNAATLIVRDVAALSMDDQERLLRWLDTPGPRIQVISTTPRPLFPQVQRGLFLENLYYRLNVVMVEAVD
jgi:hypothetical protein